MQIKSTRSIFFTLLFVIFSGLISRTYSQQRIDATILVANELRELVVYKPSGNAPMGGYPLVFMLHGTNQTGPQFYNISGWKEVAEREKFIVVFPTALIYCTTEGVFTKWSQGNTAGILCPGDTLRSDIPFFYKMIDTIATLIPINLKKVYATGFSSGGTMVPKLSIDMPGVFAAVGCGSGNLDDRDSFPMNPKVPTWAIRGTHDHGFLDRLGRPCPFNDSSLYYNASNLKNHLGSMGLTNQHSKDSAEYAIHYTFTKTLPGESPAFFRWSIYLGLEHEYFNGINYLTQLANPPIEAELFWDFFKNVSLISETDHSKTVNQIYIYPNPSTDKIQIVIPSDWEASQLEMRLYSLTGKLVFNKKVDIHSSIELNKSDCGTGIFILEILNNNKIFRNRVLFTN